MKPDLAALDTEIVPVSDVSPAIIAACSGGRDWDNQAVAEEVCFHVGRGMQHFFEAGKWLLWARHKLGHGLFLGWMEEEALPFSGRSARNYMRVAEFLLAHPALQGPLARAGLRKALQITALDDPTLERLIDGTTLPEISNLEELCDVPYIDLKREVRRLTDQKGQIDEAYSKLWRDLEKTRAALADEATISVEDEKEIEARIAKIQATFEGALAAIHTQLTLLGRVYADLSPRLKSRLDTVLHGMTIHVEHEQLALRDATGEYVPPGEAHDLMSQADRVDWPVPEARKLSVVPLDRQPGSKG